MKFLKNKWITLVLLIPLFEPGYLASIQNIHTIYKDARIIVALIITCFYIFHKKKSLFITIVLLYSLATLLSTIINHGDMSEWFSSVSYIITICMIVEIAVTDNALIILQALYYLLAILTYINFILLLMYPNGMFITSLFHDSGHFLANKNGLGGIFIPEVAIAVIYSTARFERITLSVKLLILTCFISLVIVWSGTSLIGMAIGLVYLLFIYRKNISKYISFKSLMLIYILLFIGIVLLRMQDSLSFIIEEILHKDITLTGRTIIWDHAFIMIKNSFLLGYGFAEKLLYVPYGELLYTGHNQFIQNMLKGGILATTLFVLTILISGFRLVKYKKNDYASIISVFIFSYLVMMLTDDYGNALLFFALLTMGYHLPEILKQIAIGNIVNSNNSKNNRRNIVVVPQLYLNRFSDQNKKTTAISKIIEDVVLQNSDANKAYEARKYKINQYKMKLDKTIYETIRNNSNLKDLFVEKFELGDEKTIEFEIKKLGSFKAQLMDEYNLSDVYKYNEAVKKINNNRIIIDILNDDIRKLSSVENVVESKNISLDLSFVYDLDKDISETLNKANLFWSLKKEALVKKIDFRIQELNEEIKIFEHTKSMHMYSVEKNESVRFLTQRIVHEGQRLKKILDINIRIVKLQEKLKENIESIAISCEVFREINEAYSRKINNIRNLISENIYVDVSVGVRNDSFGYALKKVLNNKSFYPQSDLHLRDFQQMNYNAENNKKLVTALLSDYAKSLKLKTLRLLLSDWYSIDYTVKKNLINDKPVRKKTLSYCQKLLER